MLCVMRAWISKAQGTGFKSLTSSWIREPRSAWVWDMTRLTDYLESLAFVDADRLAAAGCSGGGTQTAYFAAADERVRPRVCFFEPKASQALGEGEDGATSLLTGRLLGRVLSEGA